MWNESKAEGKTFWESDYGTIFKTPEGQFIAGVPRIIKLGPFDNIEEAKKFAEDSEGNINRMLENYNLEITNLCKEIKTEQK